MPLSLLLFLSLLPLSLSSTPISDLTSDLRRLRSTSPSGVIRLNDLLISRILSLSPLPFSLLIFFDANHLHSSHPELNLISLRSHFYLASNSLISKISQNPHEFDPNSQNPDGFDSNSQNPDGFDSNSQNPDGFDSNSQNPDRVGQKDLFFCDVELRESQSVFSLFEITSLPHIRLLPASVQDPKLGSIPMPPSDFESAESMVGFVESKTGIVIGPIIRPPMFSNPQKVVMAFGFLIFVIFMIKKVVSGETLLHDKRVWLSGAVFVYFFSVSGAMFNVIRKMPMFVPDRNDPSKTMYFYQGSGMQLGAEGFSIGGLYTIVGLLIAFVTHGLVKVRNGNVQRFGMFLAMLVSFLAVKQVVFLDNWKTGYGIHMYWPTSWR